MCLAKAYIRPSGGAVNGGGSGDTNGTVLLMENVANVEIDGDQLRLRSLFGASESLHARIAKIDFSEGKLILHVLDPVDVVQSAGAAAGETVEAHHGRVSR